jgi:LAO/AO transport system kinase
VQEIKAGVFEIADIDVVTKCDKPDVQKTIGDLKVMMNLGLCG